MITCAKCSNHACNRKALDQAPIGCPSLNVDTQLSEEIYQDEQNLLIAEAAAMIVSQGYGEKTRVEEIIEFAKRCNYQSIGLAFCIGLAKEAKIFEKVLVHHGFHTETIICKNGALPRDMIGVHNSSVPMCNPIGQAQYLNDMKTDLNVMLGLCIGHDSLFIKYSQAPVTVLAVKDRVLAHNPLGAIYMADSYYKERLFPEL